MAFNQNGSEISETDRLFNHLQRKRREKNVGKNSFLQWNHWARSQIGTSSPFIKGKVRSRDFGELRPPYIGVY